MATQFREREQVEEEVVAGTNMERSYAAHVVRRGFALEAFGGIAAIALSILALLGVLPTMLVSVAAIALGVAYLIESASLTSEYPKLFSRSDEPTEVAQVGSGAGAGFAAGLSGVVLGILSLAGAAPGMLLPAAVIVFGSGVLLAGMGAMKVRHVGLFATEEGGIEHDVRHEGVTTASWFSSLCGLGAVVLGIIALLTLGTPIITVPLVAVAFLAVGAATFVSGTFVARQMRRVYQGAHAH